VIAAGAVLAYVGLGMLLQGQRFLPDLETLFRAPQVLTSGGVETVGPFVLLLLPAFWAGVWTRDALRLIFKGLRAGDPPLTILKDVAVYAIGCVILIVLAFTSSSKTSGY
jgi:hypothetical protein